MTSFDIAFTLDTICPWTYIAKRRLDIALSRFRESDDGQQVKFVVKYRPYQLYPEQSSEPQDKKEFYKTTPYANTEERLKMYSTYMTALGVSVGIDFSFGGWVANTLNAHRLIQYYQEEKGPDLANKIVDCGMLSLFYIRSVTADTFAALYKQYFEQERCPSSDETLLQAATDAGIPANEAKAFVEDRNDYLVDTKMAIQEQTGNGIDSVPSIIFEGKRRDITLVGAKEVEEYEKALHQIARESQ